MSGMVLLAASWTVGPSLPTSLEPLVPCRNVINLSLFYWYYFGKCWSELAEIFPLPHSCGMSTCYSNRLLDILSPFLDDRNTSCQHVIKLYFLSLHSLWNSLAAKCISLTYDLNGCNSKVNIHLLSLGSL